MSTEKNNMKINATKFTIVVADPGTGKYCMCVCVCVCVCDT